MVLFNCRAVSIYTDSRFGQGKDPIWLSSPGCQGNESDLDQCPLDGGWDNNTCTHSSDVGLACSRLIYSRLSLSRSPRDSIQYFEISVPRHI